MEICGGLLRRSPHGERGLKYYYAQETASSKCRSPHGERGLKSKVRVICNENNESLSSRRAWIEIIFCDCLFV